MKPPDQNYVGWPWKTGGRSRDGVDCVGLACAWLESETGWMASIPASTSGGDATELLKGCSFDAAALQRGDLIFFANRTGLVKHVAIWLGDGKLLHIIQGLESRVENGFVLLRRLGLRPVAALNPKDSALAADALADPVLGDVVTWVLFGISIVLSAVSFLLAPKLNRQGNKYGRYGFDSLITRNSPEIPLPDLLGQVVVAGNSPYTQLSDKNLTSTQASQKVNKVVVLCAGPCEEVDLVDGLTINGLTYTDKYFKSDPALEGFTANPAQTKAEAVTGTIESVTLVPSFTVYPGTNDISVPVDIRASYDRTFPIYGFNGCTYVVFRLIDSAKFSQFNVTAKVRGRKCRTFDTDGFVVNTVTGEALGTGDSSTRRWKLDFDDIASVTSVTVNSVAWTEISAGNQTGNVYHLNRTKGYIEFPDNIPGAVAIAASYTYYERAWTQNPVSQVVYLLTEKLRGKGFDASKIDWDAAVEFRDRCDETVTWANSNGTLDVVRYTSNYALDYRKPVQEHLRAVLDSCRGTLFESGGKFVIRERTTGASVFSFNESNILKDSFTSELIDRSERPNRIKLFYHSASGYNAETEVIRDDRIDQLAREPRLGNDGIVDENLKFPAVDNQEQAERLGEMILRESVSSLWNCVFRTTIQGIALEPGDLVDVTHSSQPTWAAKLFRVEDVKLGEDDRLELNLTEYVAEAFL